MEVKTERMEVSMDKKGGLGGEEMETKIIKMMN